MGMCCTIHDIYEDPEIRGWRKQFEALQLKRSEVEKLYRIFRKVDADGSGTIELIELLVHIDLERTKFTERIFSIFDEDGSGQIDFREFVVALWNYCTLSRATLDLFAFDLYDADSSGMLSIKEIDGMLKDIYGKAANTNFHAKQIAVELKSMDEEVCVDAFVHFARTHHALLFPAFQMQSALQEKILGTGFWSKHANRRIEISKGKFVPIARFMELHLNKDLFNQEIIGAQSYVKPVNQGALLVLEKTGTHKNRTEVIDEEEDILNNLKGGTSRKGSVKVVKSKEERLLDNMTQDLTETYSNVAGTASAKMASIHTDGVDGRRKSSVIPTVGTVDELSGSFSPKHSRISSKNYKPGEDGNPSVNMPGFENIAEKMTSKKSKKNSTKIGGGDGSEGDSDKLSKKERKAQQRADRKSQEQERSEKRVNGAGSPDHVSPTRRNTSAFAAGMDGVGGSPPGGSLKAAGSSSSSSSKKRRTSVI